MLPPSTKISDSLNADMPEELLKQESTAEPRDSEMVKEVTDEAEDVDKKVITT